MGLSNKTFQQAADECVPEMRRAMASLGMSGLQVTPSVAMTATTEVDGEECRVRVTVELDPEDEDEDE